MPVTVDDVRKVLLAAIVQTRLGDESNAPMFADLLVGPVTDGINQVLPVQRPRTAPMDVYSSDAAPTPAGPLMLTVSDALNVRNRIASAISGTDGDGFAAGAAERLLLLEYIDVERVQSLPVEEPDPVTGVGTFTGVVATVPPRAVTGPVSVAPTTLE